jgi:hypothetical protein
MRPIRTSQRDAPRVRKAPPRAERRRGGQDRGQYRPAARLACRSQRRAGPGGKRRDRAMSSTRHGCGSSSWTPRGHGGSSAIRNASARLAPMASDRRRMNKPTATAGTMVSPNWNTNAMSFTMISMSGFSIGRSNRRGTTSTFRTEMSKTASGFRSRTRRPAQGSAIDEADDVHYQLLTYANPASSGSSQARDDDWAIR